MLYVVCRVRCVVIRCMVIVVFLLCKVGLKRFVGCGLSCVVCCLLLVLRRVFVVAGCLLFAGCDVWVLYAIVA